MAQDALLSQRLRGSSHDIDSECPEPSHSKDDVVLLLQEENDGSAKLHPTLTLEKEEKRTKTVPPVKATPASAGVPSKVLFLDGLRGLAAMLVIVKHAGFMKIGMGEPAVDTFFVLSAFLLTMLFEKKARMLLEQNASYKRWRYALVDYFVRRFLRVYPLFFVVAVVVWAMSNEDRQRYFFVKHPEDYDLIRTLFFEFKYRYHVFWTLPLEITYYFIIPVFVVAMLKLKKYWFVAMVPLTVYVVHEGFYSYRSNHQPLKPHLPTFLCGSMAAVVYAKIDQWITRRQFVFRWYHGLMLGTIKYVSLVLLFSTVFHGLFFDWVTKNPIPQTHGASFISVPVAVIIVCEMLQRGGISSVLEWSLLRYAGKISFSMYMLHSFVIYSDWVNRQSFYNKFFSVWVLSFLLSTVSFYLIEYPCQWLTGYIGKAIKVRDDAARAYERQALPSTTKLTGSN